jgi:glycosyltransferase involved in cell wall biosynthesis/O-antigen/teichoic acid export membrane protein
LNELSDSQLSPSTFLSTLKSKLNSGVFGRGGLSFLIATAGINVSNFIFHVIVSRLLGPSHYGAMGALLSILSLLAVPIGAAQIAVTQAVIGKESQGQPFSISRVSRRAFVGGVLAMILLIVLTPVIDKFLHIHSPLPMILLSTWIPLTTVAAVLQGALIGEYRFRPVAFATFVGGGPIRLILGSVLVLAGLGVSGAIAATIFAQGFSTASLLFSARHQLVSNKKSPSITTKTRDMTLSIAALAGYTAFIGIDTFLARHFFTASVAGKYAAAAIAAHMAFFVPGALVTVAFPHLVDGRGTNRSSRKIFSQSLTVTALLGVIVALILTIFSSLVIRILFGVKYIKAIVAVGTLSFASVMIGILILFVYLHLARRSLFALAPWFGVALATGMISLHHGSMESVATIMLIVSALTMFVAGIPAFLALVRASAKEIGRVPVWDDLKPAEVELTLVVPFFNPGTRLGPHVRELIETLTDAGITFEVLAVSDGSTDNSEAQLEMITSDYLRLVRFEKNRGKGAVLHAALSSGRGEYLGFIDGDGDIPADSLIEFLTIIQRERPDMVYGSKRHARSEVIYPPLRRLYSWGYQQLNRVLFGLPISDTQTGVKIISREVLSASLPLMVEKRFAFDLELFVVAREQGFRNFIEMPVIIGERFGSTVSLRSVGNMLKDTAAIFYRQKILRYYDRDLRTHPDNSLLSESSDRAGSPQEDAPSAVTTSSNSQRRRILIFNWRDLSHPRAGGAEVYTHNLAREWVKAGHDVTLFCASVAGRPATEDAEGVHVVRRGSKLSVYREARRYYRREGRGKFDLVIDEVNTRPFFAHAWVDDAQVIALFHQICRELWFYQLPYPLALVGRYFLEPTWLRRYRDVETVTVSQSSKDSLEEGGLRRVTIVAEGHSPLPQIPQVQRESRPTVVFVGRLEAHKRPQHAIRAFEMVQKSIPDAIMWVIGSGPMEDQLRRTAPEGVVFLGKVSREIKIDRLARAHVMLLTSVREGWGLVVTEAAEVGTRSIAYDVPGLRDSVAASNGILTGSSPEQLSAALKEALASASENHLTIVSPGGVIPWSHVAAQILELSDASKSDKFSSLA